MTNDLVEKLRALHVWPQIVADDHADLLTPRRIDKLYEVGRVSHEAADLIETQAREIERLTLTVRKLQGNQAALEAELAKFKALAETLARELQQIEVDAMEYYNEWRETGCDQKDAIRFAFGLGETTRKALHKYKEARDADKG